MILLLSIAHAVPERQVPPSVLNEVRLLENRFDIALAEDCDATRCFSKGCTYVDHAVTDRPRTTSLPGLTEQNAGPGSVEPQEFLTSARCQFAYEENLETEDVRALSRRLQNKLSKGWTVVSVGYQKLQPLPEYVGKPHEPPPPPEPVAPPEPALPPPPPQQASLFRELWIALLPHLYWMLGILLITGAGAALIWSWRRLGQQSIEEQMLLAEIGRGEPEPAAPMQATVVEEYDDADFVADQDAIWRERLDGMDPADPDAEVQALIGELLRSGDLPLLAKAVMRFPDTLPAAFPEGGEFAAAKLELAAFLKTVEPDSLPSDADFFRALNRMALSATVASQSDANIVRSLREEFGAAGLSELIQRLPPRPGALLFALSPAQEQREMVRLLAPKRVAEMAGMLLRSNRMDPTETSHLFGVLDAARSGTKLPAPPSSGVSDRGTEFDAASALSLLLESVNPTRRAALFTEALGRFGGSLPSWYRNILVSDMLDSLSTEARADLMLAVELEPLAAWMSMLDTEVRDRLQAGLPSTLRTSLQAVSVFPSRARQIALAEQGRGELARGFQSQLARSKTPFEQVVAPPESA